MRLCTYAPVAAIVTLLASSARADQTARLVYARGPSAESCPDEPAVRAAVAARLGYDPFRPVAPLTIIATVTRTGATFHGDVRLLGERGDEVGSRAIGNGSERCEEIIAALGLTISVAIDPLLLTRPPPPPTSATPGAPVEAAPPPPVVSVPLPPPSPPSRPPETAAVSLDPVTEPRSSGRPFVSASLVGSLGSAPSPAFGFALGGGYRIGRFSLGVEAHADLPSASVTYGSGDNTPSYSSFLILGTLLPCVHVSIAFGCAAASGGLLTASSEGIAQPTTGRRFYASVGPRVGAEVPVTAHVALRGSAELGVPLVQAPFSENGPLGPTYTPPPVSGALALGAAYLF